MTLNENQPGRGSDISAFNESSPTSYWIFQCSPKAFDIETALRTGVLDDWTISAHKGRIKTGDKVIIWVTGENSGCYALAEIVYEPRIVDSSDDDSLWKVENTNSLKAGIRITHNLVERPILKENIANIPALSDLKVGNQGTNFTATETEFEVLRRIAENNPSARYWIYAPGENARLWDEFYDNGIM
ncbi:MAG: EVE domain-containing protein, partial [Chryseobacterium sp.]